MHKHKPWHGLKIAWPAEPQFSPPLTTIPAAWRWFSASNSQYEWALGHLECVGLNLRQPLDALGIKLDGVFSGEAVKCIILFRG